MAHHVTAQAQNDPRHKTDQAQNGPSRNAQAQNGPRHKTAKHNAAHGKKLPKAQNGPRHKTAHGTKRPTAQNGPKHKTAHGMKRFRAQSPQHKTAHSSDMFLSHILQQSFDKRLRIPLLEKNGIVWNENFVERLHPWFLGPTKVFMNTNFG
jgi:hypothetical protein